MDNQHLMELLKRVQSGQTDLDSAMSQLKKLPFENLGYARIDNHRCVRTGVSEVIYCEGKTIEQTQGIDVVLVPLDDRARFHSGGLDRHELVDRTMTGRDRDRGVACARRVAEGVRPDHPVVGDQILDRQPQRFHPVGQRRFLFGHSPIVLRRTCDRSRERG